MSLKVEVPPLPVAHARALSLLKEPEPGVSAISELVDTDPALTAAVIRLANSAASSPIDRVRTARMAIVRVGVTEARRVVLGVALSSAFTGMNGSHIDEGELWRHLIATAILADATAWGTTDQSEAFTAGLLHDIGRLAMATQNPGRYATVVARARQGADPVQAERAVFGLGHIEWGEAVGRAWGIPSEITQAIANHHHGELSGLAWVVKQGRELSASLGIGDGVTEPEPDGTQTPAAGIPVISELGGADAVMQRVQWYRGALRAA